MSTLTSPSEHNPMSFNVNSLKSKYFYVILLLKDFFNFIILYYYSGHWFNAVLIDIFPIQST